MTGVGFVQILGYILGILILYVIMRVLFAPVRYIVRLLFNSVLGAGVLIVINYFSRYTSIFIGINPLSCLTIGILGLPGLLLLVLFKLFFDG